MKKALPWLALGAAVLGGGAYFFMHHRKEAVKAASGGEKKKDPPKKDSGGFSLSDLDPTTSKSKYGGQVKDALGKAGHWLSSLF